jgi:predicted transposase YbfD/YdcC
MAKRKVKQVESLLEHFKELEDPRSTVNRLHRLGDLIVISVLAVIAGADGPTSISVWAKAQSRWLEDHLDLPHGIPSKDTFRRLLQSLKPEAFQSCFQTWILAVQREQAVDAREVIAVDGKALRRSHDGRRELGPLYLVSAWAAESGMSLGQVAAEEKSNEITAIPELLKEIDVKDAIVTIDAAGCQRDIAESILANKGDYVLTLKGNQQTLHQDVVDYVTQQLDDELSSAHSRHHREVVKGHGRLDELDYYQLQVPREIAEKHNWPGLRTIGVAVRQSEQQGKSSFDVRYFISSLTMGVKEFARAIRKHWSIENSLHWCLDVTFREDESRVRDRNEANNLAWLKRFAISLLKQQTDKHSIAMRRRQAGWNVNYLAKTIGLQTS